MLVNFCPLRGHTSGDLDGGFSALVPVFFCRSQLAFDRVDILVRFFGLIGIVHGAS